MQHLHFLFQWILFFFTTFKSITYIWKFMQFKITQLTIYLTIIKQHTRSVFIKISQSWCLAAEDTHSVFFKMKAFLSNWMNKMNWTKLLMHELASIYSVIQAQKYCCASNLGSIPGQVCLF